VAKFSPTQKENVVKEELAREEREGGEVNCRQRRRRGIFVVHQP
jgi:hypothetical protein